MDDDSQRAQCSAGLERVSPKSHRAGLRCLMGRVCMNGPFIGFILDSSRIVLDEPTVLHMGARCGSMSSFLANLTANFSANEHILNTTEERSVLKEASLKP